MPYYTTPQNYTHNLYNNYNNNYHNNKYFNNYHKGQYGNGWTAMNWAKKWYPGWQTHSYKWKNNCWWVYIKKGYQWRTVCVSPYYNWHWYQSGYRW